MGKKAKPVHVEVAPRKNESPERMIKRFIRKVKKSGVMEEYRNRRLTIDQATRHDGCFFFEPEKQTVPGRFPVQFGG